jgi:polysaccharide deacetylase 2 family uncharacterized protein YibQ
VYARPSARKSVLAFSLALLAVSVFLSGCGKIRSAVRSLLHSNRASETSPVPAPTPHSARPAVAGPRLAIILDDLAGDSVVADAIFSLHYPLTVSILPNHPHSSEIAEHAHRRGFQVMLHLPMESVAKEKAEIQELRPGMTPKQISNLFNTMLGTVPFAMGVNNHQGSLATSDPRLMSELMPLLHAHKLFFIDSRTTADSFAYRAAQSAGVRSAFRNVPFLDDVPELGAIRRQLDLAAADAREKGEAIAIGHPHPATLRALAEFLPQAQAEGIRLVHASDLVH